MARVECTLTALGAVRGVVVVGVAKRLVRELGECRGSEAMPAGAIESLPLLSSVLSVVDAGEFEARVLEHLL